MKRKKFLKGFFTKPRKHVGYNRYIFNFNEYEYMIIESDDSKIIAKIRPDSINVKDGYRVRMRPRKNKQVAE